MPKFPQSGQFHGESNKRGAFLGAWAIAGFFNHLNLARNNFGATPAQFQVSEPTQNYAEVLKATQKSYA